MRGRLAFVAVIAACYSPSAQPGAPCGPGGACPAGQACVVGICGGTEPLDDAPTGDDAPDAPSADGMTDAAPDGASYVPWGTPLKLTTLETPGSGESDPSVTSNKLTAVLTAEVATGDTDIYFATRSAVTDTFTFVSLTAVNAATFAESSPEISSDGLTLFFVSNRSGSFEVYESTFSTTWSTPTIRTDLSSASSDGDLAISPDGLTAAVVREGSTDRIYIHTRASTAVPFGAGVLHSELNVTADIAAPTITNGGQIIYLHAGGPRQLYKATRQGNGTYTTPQPVTELNVTGTRTASPFVLEGDDYMIYEIAGDIYETTR